MCDKRLLLASVGSPAPLFTLAPGRLTIGAGGRAHESGLLAVVAANKPGGWRKVGASRAGRREQLARWAHNLLSRHFNTPICNLRAGRRLLRRERIPPAGLSADELSRPRGRSAK